MNFIEQIIDDLDEEFLQDFLDSIYNEQSSIEQYLMHIHKAPNQQERLKSLFGPLEKLKMVCRLGFLDPLVSYVQVAEDLIDTLLIEKAVITEELAEFLLLIFDELRAASEDLVERHTLDTVLLSSLHDKIRDLIDSGPSNQNEEIKFLIEEFTPRVHADLVFNAFESTLKEIKKPVIEIDADLEVFKGLAECLDQRCQHWDRRTGKLLHMALLINEELPNSVDKAQMAGAVYMHDIAMAFLPDSLLHKTGRYDAIDIMLLQQHPIQSYEILHRMQDWQEAALIVHQHHERPDGKGYPHGLKSKDIHLGASILALVDTYFSLTTQRSDRQYTKSALRAISELNRNNGTQFNPLVISAFNGLFSESMFDQDEA
ncbi:MAG: hypothetical protein COB04_09365 [Gammaproteobacteria bacterium]|nr:MAG: hypothetical protein COB04_09365 [Gammaproteobacteria bacterium]